MSAAERHLETNSKLKNVHQYIDSVRRYNTMKFALILFLVTKFDIVTMVFLDRNKMF